MSAAATPLNLLAVQNAALLRELAKPGDLRSVVELARAINRDKSNVSKTLNVLKVEGLVLSEPLRLTTEGQHQLAMLDRAETPAGEPGLSDGDRLNLSLLHAQVLPDPDNAREDWNSDEARMALMALRMDIVEHGQHQNLLVRAMTAEEVEASTLNAANDEVLAEGLTLYRLVAGERRWRAIGEAIDEDDWATNRTIACRLIETDDLGLRIAALSENLQRRDLNPIEKARGFEALADAGLSNADIADRFGKTPEHIQQHRRFLQLDEADQQRMTLSRDDPRRLGVKEARQKLAQKEARKPLDLTPEQRLVFAEMAHKARTKGGYALGDFEVGQAATSDALIPELIELKICGGPHRKNYGEFNGRFADSLNWYGKPENHFAWFDKGKGKELAAGLAEEQALAGRAPEEGATYVTTWLNGPFDLDAEGLAMVEAAKAHETAQAQRGVEAEAREQVRLARVAEIRRKHLDLLNAAAEAPPTSVGEGTIETAAEIDRPLPWTVRYDAVVVAANGREVKRFGNWGTPTDEEMTLAQVVAVAVNSAAGLATPPVLTREVADKAARQVDEETFLQTIANELEDRAEDEADGDDRDDDVRDAYWLAQARIVLTNFLEDNGVAFGDDGFDWCLDAVRLLVEAHTAPDKEDQTEQADA